MLPAMLLSFIAALWVPALAIQFPSGSSQRRLQDKNLNPGVLTHRDLTEWNFHTLPNPNTTDNLMFETVHSLLQHWPNTRMRNGHNIVPGRIPKGTLLYHGRSDNELPPGPEWTATDPEHSYFYCRSLPDRPGCWHLTLVTTRPLKVVYFDGNSAAKLPYGSLDAQDLIVWGRIGNDPFGEEMGRIQDLCKWGKNFGVDGFVRMEQDFEVMLCNFTSGVSVVSFANLVGGILNRSTLMSSESFEAMNAGAWHNRFPGETRIQLDLAGLVSFYDIQLAPSLVPIRAGLERWDHRAANISGEELSALKSKLEAILIRPEGVSSGIDWKTLIQVIVNRYAQRLELTRYLLNSSVTDPDHTLDRAKKVQTQLRIMLRPYILLSATPVNPFDGDELEWAIPIYRNCATTHTFGMESQSESMTDSEKLLLRTVRGTNKEICRVVTKMWAAGVYAGIDPSLNTKVSPNTTEVARLREAWEEELDRLMAWLDWSVWVKCNPSCDVEEMCYLPTWPVGFPGEGKEPSSRPPLRPGPDRPDGPPPEPVERQANFELRGTMMEGFAERMWETVQPDPNEWVRPQPKCIRRIEPYWT